MSSLTSIMVTNNDGSSPTSVCVDPVALNYNTGGPTCKYKPVPTGKENIALWTNWPFGMYMSQSGASKKIFLNGIGGGNGSLAAGSPSMPAPGKDLPSGYLFMLTRNDCISRTTPPTGKTGKGAGEQLYYGDYVQIARAYPDKKGNIMPAGYFNPGNAQNLFSSEPGACTNKDWQTFQILHVDSGGKVSVNGNSPVIIGDNISLISIGAKSGAALQVGSKFVSAGLSAAALSGAPAKQHAPGTETKMMDGHMMSHTEFAMYADRELKSIFTVDNIIIAILVLALLLFIWFRFIKKK